MAVRREQTTMKRGRKWHILISLALIASLLAPLLAWGYISLFTRYWYDDFCYTSVVNKLGFVKSQLYWYRHWTGRYTFLFINAVLAYIGPRTASFLGATLLPAWLAAATWAIYQLFSLMRLPSPLISSFLLAELIIYATLNSAPDIVTSFYWQTGILVYTVPLVLLMLYIGLLLYVVRKKLHLGVSSPWVIAGALLTFVAGGCSEIYGVMQTVGLSLLIIFTLKYSSGSAKRLLLLMAISGLLGSVLSISILALAPGNDVRRDYFPPHPHLIQVVKSSLSYSLSFIERHARRSRGTTVLSLLFPMWLAFALHLCKPNGLNIWPASEADRKRLVQLFALSPMAVFILLAVSFAPGFYLLSEALPGRAHFFPKFILITSIVFWVFLGSLALVKVLEQSARLRNALMVVSSVAVLALSIISPLASARHTFGLRFKASHSASVWDGEDKRIRLSRSQGVKDLFVPSVNASEWQLGFGRSDLLPTPDPADPRNRCLAEYYGLDTLTVK